MNCPNCGINQDNIDDRVDPYTEFLLGYGCYVCGHQWPATEKQRRVHDERMKRIRERRAKIEAERSS